MAAPPPSPDSHTAPVRLAASLFTRRPLLTIALVFLPAILSVIPVAITGDFFISSPTISDYFLRDDIHTRLDDAREAAQLKYTLPAEAASATLNRSRPSSSFTLILLFRAPSPQQKILTPSRIAAMKRAEDVILNHPLWPKFCFQSTFDTLCNASAPRPACALPNSILLSPHLYGIPSESGPICARRNGSVAPSQANVSSFIQSLNSSSEYTSLLGERDPSESTWIAYSRLIVATPFEGLSDDPSSVVAANRIYSGWILPLTSTFRDAAQPELDAYVLSFALSHTRVGSAISKDMYLAVASLFIVSSLVAFHTRSLFLCVVTLVQVSLAIPLSFCIYRYIFRIQYFSALHVFAVFLVLGIAADDVFVFTDAWKQATAVLGDADMYRKMAWTYGRIVKAVSITSFTTAAALLLMVLTPIMPISTFGCWGAILILVQYMLVITAYPCALVIWDTYLRKRSWVPWSMQGGFRKSFFRSQSLETEERAVGAGDEVTSAGGGRVIFGWLHWGSSKERPERSEESEGSEATEEHDYRVLERWFYGPWVDFLKRSRYAICVLGLAALVTVVTLSLLLELLEAPETILKPTHSDEIAQRDLRSEFNHSFGNNRMEVRFTWGIRDIDRTGTSNYVREERGRVVMDEEFDIKPAAVQKHMLKMCKALGEDERLVATDVPREERIRCWIEDFMKWRSEEARLGGIVDYTSDVWLMYDILAFGNYRREETGSRPYFKYFTGKDIMVSTDLRRIVTSEIRVLSQQRWYGKQEEKTHWEEQWERFKEEWNGIGPRSGNGMIATAGIPWMFSRSQAVLMRSLKSGVGILLGLTGVFLTAATGSVVVGLTATGCVGGVIGGVFGLVYVAGWKVGVAECLVGVVSVGYAFDGVAHMGMAVAEGKGLEREGRVREGLRALGLSIMMGSLSTLGSSMVLVAGTVTLLNKMGWLIGMAMVGTMVWSLVVLPGVLLVVGPSGDEEGLVTRFVNKSFAWVKIIFQRRDIV